MDNSGVEDVCYEQAHVKRVLDVIKQNFDTYFLRFLDTTAGKGISLKDIQELQKKLGVEVRQQKKNNDLTANYKTIIRESIDDFEKDRKDYEDIFDRNG